MNAQEMDKLFPGFANPQIRIVEDDGVERDGEFSGSVADAYVPADISDGFSSYLGAEFYAPEEEEAIEVAAPVIVDEAIAPAKPGSRAQVPAFDRMKRMDAEQIGDPGAETDDAIFEATIDTVRATGFVINRDDETYAVMKFMYHAFKRIEGEMREERRTEQDDMMASVISLREEFGRLAATQDDVVAVLVSKMNDASLDSTDTLVRSTAKVLAYTEDRIKGALEKTETAAEDAFNKKFRKLVSSEVRIGLGKGLEAEMKLLQNAVENAADALERATKATTARASKGWIQNAVDDFQALQMQHQVGIGGGFIALLLAIVIF